MFDVIAMILALSQLTPVQTAAEKPPFIVTDRRPEKERKRPISLKSAFMFNCDLGIFVVGEDGAGKGHAGARRVADLNDYLVQRFGPTIAGHQLDISKYHLVINGAAGAKAFSVSSGLGGGILAPLIANGVTRRPKCAKERMSAGWFDPSELRNNNTPIVVEITGQLDGAPVEVRSVTSPQRDLTSGVFIIKYNRADEADFQAAVDAAEQKFGDRVGELLRIAPPVQSAH